METQVQQEIERFEADGDYVQEHREELLRQHPERWVAVYNLQVVAVARNISTLVRQLKRKGIPPGHAYRAYLTENEPFLILSAPQ
jgi:hypothetical protein